MFSAIALGPNEQLLPGVPVSWRSTNVAVATVLPASGTATAVGFGTTRITASAGSVEADAELIVRRRN